jgi:uncharacterized protein
MSGSGPTGSSGAQEAVNRHPAVMFEILSPRPEQARRFYSDVFGWSYDSGTEGFSYVQFAYAPPSVLGGIGQADDGTPGLEQGTNFYLLVDDLEDTLGRVLLAGGAALLPPSAADGYHFAMFTDPDGFRIGLIQRFS